MSNASMGSGEATPPHSPPYMFITKFSCLSIQQMQEEGTQTLPIKLGAFTTGEI
jgi:hypothetical protein